MLIPMSHVKIFCSLLPADMRCGFDRLAQMCKAHLGEDPYAGHLYLFFNRGLDIARIVYFDGSGCCTFTKRLEKGRYKIPQSSSGSHVSIAASELSLLLEGVRISSLKRPKPWQPSPSH